MERDRGDSPSDAVLDELLDTAARTGPEYGDGLSSHLPMALHALRALGASDDRLRQFADLSLQRMGAEAHDRVSSRPIDGAWQDRRGQLAEWVPLVAHFQAEITAEGPDAVLRRVLPDLVSGVAGAAFHGLIRAAHAAESRHRSELASALAYWACRWSPLPHGGGGGRLDFKPWRDILLAAPTWPRPPGRLIADRIQHVVHTPAFEGLVGRLPGSPAVLAGLAALAGDRYRASRNFTVLHLVTASRAMRVLGPWWVDLPGAVGHFADAFAAAYLACGIDPAAARPPAAGLGWHEVVDRAVASEDSHVIKLVHACRDEAAVRGDADGWLQVAGLAVS